VTGLGAVAPGIGTTPTSNGESGSEPSQEPEDAPVPSSLAPTKPSADAPVDTAPPVTPENSRTPYVLGLTTNLVEVPFTVKDSKGHLVPGLTWRDVHVYENNVIMHPRIFTVDPYPLSVGVVIDNSLGIHEMATVSNSLGALQGAFTPYDEVAVFTYNNGPKMVTGFTGGQSARLGAAIELSKATGREYGFYDTSGPMSRGININGGANDHENPLTSGGPGSPQGMSQITPPKEYHSLNDAIFLAAQHVAKAAVGRRRIVYVISDGKEYGSQIKQKDLIKYLQQNRIEVWATLVGDSSVAGMGFIDSLHLPAMMRDNILPVYTKATGGQFFADYRSKAIEMSFAKITEEARQQYTIWYSSPEPAIDGKFRKIDVRVLRPNLQVIAKNGYYPSATEQKPRSTARAAAPAGTTPPPPRP
jgi:VWFA-related protein